MHSKARARPKRNNHKLPLNLAMFMNPRGDS